MDVSDYLKSSFQAYHKSKGAMFGKRLSTNTRSLTLKVQRQITRDKLMCAKRNMSPCTPNVSIKEHKPSKEEVQIKKRFEQLKQWKQNKIKKLEEEKLKRKPIFKVSHVSFGIGIADLENINKTIKGKPIKLNLKRKDPTPIKSNTKHIDPTPIRTNIKKKDPTPAKLNFAPENYKFKGPAHLKPLQIDIPTKQRQRGIVKQANVFEDEGKIVKKVQINPDNKFTTPKNIPKTYKKTPAKVNNMKKLEHRHNDKENIKHDMNLKQYDLRSRKVTLTKNTEKLSKLTGSNGKGNSRTRAVKIKKIEQTKVLQLKKTEVTEIEDAPECQLDKVSVKSELSTEYPMDEHMNARQSDFGTPRNTESKDKPIVYISPFVTISRGKNSARKEYHYRKSKGGFCDTSPDIESCTGPKAGAAYFHSVLYSEIARIQALCDEWNLYKETEKPPEGACDMINVAIGQAQLLLDKKFKQFGNLINSCEAGDSAMPITCEDLHGYWDTAYIQVENVNLRFENLVKMRSNNWEEIVPKLKVKVVKKTVPSKPKTQASSTLRDAIRAARNKAKAKTESEQTDGRMITTSNGSFVSFITPEKASRLLTPTSIHKTSERKRKSLRTSVLVNSPAKYPRFRNSLVSESRKCSSSPGLIMLKVAQTAKSVEKDLDTPGRSILKPSHSKSSAKRPKSVLFKNEESAETLIAFPHEKDPPRMSLRRRLVPNKLF